MESAVLRLAMVLDPVLSARASTDIHDGLNVIYGLNGAGKTRLLAGIRNALNGVRGERTVGLLVHAGKNGDDAISRNRNAGTSVTEAIARAIASPSDFEYFTQGKPVSEQRLDPARASELVHEYLDALAPVSGEARDWILENRLFLFVPAGSPAAPLWEVWPVADPQLDWVQREETSLNDAFERYEEEYVFDDEEDYEEDVQADVERHYRERVAASPLFPVMDREIHPSTKSGHVWNLGPYSPIGYGLPSSAYVESVVVSGAVDFGVQLIDYEQPIEVATAQYLAAKLAPLVQPFFRHDDAVDVDVEGQADATANELGNEVSTRLRSVLLDGPYAHLTLTPAPARLFKSPFEWRFTRDEGSGRAVPLDKLSRAERLWAERAILETLHYAQAKGAAQTLHVYDEPEAALHRAAESHMARALTSVAQDPRSVVVAATHSPELLDVPEATVIEVRRSAGRSMVQELDRTSKTVLTDLGLNPSDLLRLTRVFLLVEGLHDEVLLQHFLGDRLRAARVDVIPIRGGKNLAHTTDSRVLYDYTSAHVVALLDNTKAEHVRDVWSRAAESAATGDVVEAKSIVTDEIGNADGESQYLTSWLTRAIDDGLESRLSPMGLPAADIIEYLPVERVVSRAKTWNDLRTEHAQLRHTKTGIPKDFKQWLEVRYKTSFTADSLRAYAEGVPTPKDFEVLMKSLEALSADDRTPVQPGA